MNREIDEEVRQSSAGRQPTPVPPATAPPVTDWRIEVVSIPVTDVDRAKAFYVDQVGFTADHDHQVDENVRFVQLTPPGSACSIVLGTGLTTMTPGSQRDLMVVVPNADDARAHLVARGVEASDVDEQEWGRFVYFADPDGNTWALQELPDYAQQASPDA